MYKVVNAPKGTAWKSRVKDQSFDISGKTGTSQVRIISKQERESGIIKNKDLPYEKRDHALFVAFAPYHKPRYSISVLVEHGGSGSKSAAPIAKQVLKKVLEKHTNRENYRKDIKTI